MVKTIEFKGRQMTAYDLSKEYNIPRTTIQDRYDKGKRDDELISDNRRSGKVNTTYYIDGKPCRMTSSEKRKRSTSKLTTYEIQERLNLGMSMTEALHYSNRYTAKFGQLCYRVKGLESVYYIPMEDVRALNEHGITMVYIVRNVLFVDDISELLLEDTRVYEEDLEYDVEFQNKIKQKHREQKIQEYKDIKYREEHPHLFDGTPQTHEWGDYAEYLASSYTFSCRDIKEETNNE